ncbi:nuclear transport factor 2 family protein [Desulfovibrio desulfuricans]|uniref:nuclear transport factor 2 family protein n=1 Tax=Desulfovibrio desulfuricans TaxID=876 RepID=UPI001AE200C0|nr:nuclear transport factor 2 family protein [Desulfovibrio desulfuricans]MDD3684630.1 ketosteroid isomerase family protein [Desulfovibrio desulfuricans]QTO39143.1 nuclear transport factor 2 family protein [Desulfovibrio desulfuricans]
MNTSMPKPVEIFMETMNSADTEKLDSCLARDAVLFDPAENNEISGINAIKAFVTDSKEKFDLCTTVIDATSTAESTKVIALTKGNFPGSPQKFSYEFIVKHGLIQSINILPA